MAMMVEKGNSLASYHNLQIITLGDAQFMFVPGELYVEAGIELLKKSAAEYPFVVTVSNGCGRYFFTQKSAQYFVLEDGGSYVSALRIEQYKDGLLLCALETKPGCRCKGYAKHLVNAVLNYVSAPVYSHISKKNKPSISVHLSCGFCKLHDGARFLDGSVNALSDTYIYTK
jgi:hypothetical protein